MVFICNEIGCKRPVCNEVALSIFFPSRKEKCGFFCLILACFLSINLKEKSFKKRGLLLLSALFKFMHFLYYASFLERGHKCVSIKFFLSTSKSSFASAASGSTLMISNNLLEFRNQLGFWKTSAAMLGKSLIKFQELNFFCATSIIIQMHSGASFSGKTSNWPI